MPFANLHRLPGTTPHIETNLMPGELITAFIVPGAPRRRSLYRKIRDRESYEFANASAAVALELDGDAIRDVRIGLGVMGQPIRRRESIAKVTGRFMYATDASPGKMPLQACFLTSGIVPRMTGAFAAGRIINTRTARSQLMGGMTWGMASALLEATALDEKRGRFIKDGFGEYLIAVNADVPRVEVHLVREEDNEVNPLGVKGIGELGIVGTAAAVASAVHHATGIRIRALPIVLDKLLV